MSRVKKSRGGAVWQSAYETRLSRGERVAFAYSPATALEVPRLPKLQTKAQFGGGDQKPLALAMARAGLLKPHHWIGDVDNAIEEAFTEAFRFVHAEVDFYLTEDVMTKNPYDTTGAFDSAAENFRAKHGLLEDRKISAFQIHPSEHPRWVTVGERLRTYEAHHADLGRTILWTIEEAMGSHLDLLGPRKIYDLCQMWEWGGETDESMRLEEYFGDSQVCQEIEKELSARRKPKPPKPLVEVLSKPSRPGRRYELNLKDLTPEQREQLLKEWGGITEEGFFEAFPEWVVDDSARGLLDLEQVKIKPLRDATLLKSCTLNDLLHEVVKLQQHTRQWRDKLRDGNHIAWMNGDDDLEQSDLHSPYVVHFSAQDGVTDLVLDRIHDNEANCGNFIDLAYQHLFCADDPRQMEAAMSLVLPICESLRMVEKILQAIGET